LIGWIGSHEKIQILVGDGPDITKNRMEYLI